MDALAETIKQRAAIDRAPSVGRRAYAKESAQGLLGYRTRFAESRDDIQAALRLRFKVFSLELNEGPASAFEEGYETDEFDAICDHLLVEHVATREVIGTYRMQTGRAARRNRGYYSEREFGFSVYEGLRDSMLELGRACIHRDHRSFDVLLMLWRGVARYARERDLRYLIGCSSLTSQSAAEGWSVYRQLQPYLVESRLRTSPFPAFLLPCEERDQPMGSLKPPRLLRAYLSVGARICGEPAIDREFRTIDFLTLLDLQDLPSVARTRFFEEAL
jgi:putative hemolysin